MAKFVKRIIRPGTYSIRRKDGTTTRIHIGRERIKRWVDNFTKMKASGLKIPAPWRHEEKAQPARLDADHSDWDAYNNGGFWEELHVGDDGALYGTVDVPNAKDAEKVGTTVQDVSLLAKPEWMDGEGTKYQDAITHIAMVVHPVAKDDQNFVPQDAPAIALSLSEFYSADDTTTGDEGDSVPEGDGPKAGSATVKDVMQLLREVAKVTLPEDTTADNMLERLVTALSAIRGQKSEENPEGESVKEPPAGSKKQPGPVAMSLENYEFAAQMLGTAKVVNPATKKPWTAAELEAKDKADKAKNTVALSAEDQATINWARKSARNAYKSRIEACVASGRVDPKTAKEFWDTLSADEDLKLSFDESGSPVANHYDFVISAWERTPANASLTGHSPTSAKATKAKVFGGDAFSLDAGVTEEDPPNNEATPMSLEEADAILATQFQSSGMTQAEVEGPITAK